MRDYYRILGIQPDATQDEIKEAWLFSVKAFHPDKFARSSQRQHAVAQERTKAVNEAYEFLSDQVRRAGYDREYARKPRTHSAAQSPPQPPPQPPPRSTSPPTPPNTATWPPTALTAGLILCLALVLWWLVSMIQSDREERLHRLSTERKENGVVTNRASLAVAPDDLKKITLFDLEDRSRGVFGRVRNDLSRPVERIGLQASFYTPAGQLVAVRRFWMGAADDARRLPTLLSNSPVYFYSPVEDMPRDCTYRLEVIEAHYVNE